MQLFRLLNDGEDDMNTRSSINQNKRVNPARHTGKLGVKAGQNSPKHLHKQELFKKQAIDANHQGASSLQLSSTEQEAILRQRALLAAQHGNHSAAIAIFSELIARNPDNANHYSNRGLVYFQSGKADCAISDYNRALELNPRLDSAYNNRANYYAAQGQFFEAILDYDIALDLNPANVRAWINQGITFRDLGMYDRALESFDLALCLGKLEGHIYAERGRTYHLRGDWNCAIGEYQKALEKLVQSSPNFEGAALRSYLQVEAWLEELLNPLQAS